jgi:hypothetical protein
MLSTMFESCRRFFNKRLSGWKNCGKCPCGQYEAAGNDYCRCGHAFEDHW